MHIIKLFSISYQSHKTIFFFKEYKISTESFSFNALMYSLIFHPSFWHIIITMTSYLHVGRYSITTNSSSKFCPSTTKYQSPFCSLISKSDQAIASKFLRKRFTWTLGMVALKNIGDDWGKVWTGLKWIRWLLSLSSLMKSLEAFTLMTAFHNPSCGSRFNSYLQESEHVSVKQPS